jgi:hypothetical protein
MAHPAATFRTRLRVDSWLRCQGGAGTSRFPSTTLLSWDCICARAKANGVHMGRRPKLTEHQKREAIKRRDVDDETLRSIGRSYNVSAAAISRL